MTPLTLAALVQQFFTDRLYTQMEGSPNTIAVVANSPPGPGATFVAARYYVRTATARIVDMWPLLERAAYNCQRRKA